MVQWGSIKRLDRRSMPLLESPRSGGSKRVTASISKFLKGPTYVKAHNNNIHAYSLAGSHSSAELRTWTPTFYCLEVTQVLGVEYSNSHEYVRIITENDAFWRNCSDSALKRCDVVVDIISRRPSLIHTRALGGRGLHALQPWII